MCFFSNACNNDTTKRIKNLNGSSAHTTRALTIAENIQNKMFIPLCNSHIYKAEESTFTLSKIKFFFYVSFFQKKCKNNIQTEKFI